MEAMFRAGRSFGVLGERQEGGMRRLVAWEFWMTRYGQSPVKQHFVRFKLSYQGYEKGQEANQAPSSVLCRGGVELHLTPAAQAQRKSY